MIENLSNSIMVPIAGVILAIVMTVDPVSYTHLLYSEYYGEYSDYTRKGGVICSYILLPSHAPPEYADRQTPVSYTHLDVYKRQPYQIASKLKEEKILIPAAYLAQHGEGVNKNKTFKDVYGMFLLYTLCTIALFPLANPGVIAQLSHWQLACLIFCGLNTFCLLYTSPGRSHNFRR